MPLLYMTELVGHSVKQLNVSISKERMNNSFFSHLDHKFFLIDKGIKNILLLLDFCTLAGRYQKYGMESMQ